MQKKEVKLRIRTFPRYAKRETHFHHLCRRKRTPPKDEFVLNESDIHSGDFFGVIRLDGLDSMLAFGMGSHTGHTTVALWEETWLAKRWQSGGLNMMNSHNQLQPICIQGRAAICCREQRQWFVLVGHSCSVASFCELVS